MIVNLTQRYWKEMSGKCRKYVWESILKNEQETKTNNLKSFKRAWKNYRFLLNKQIFKKDVENTIVFYWTRIFLNKFLKKGSFFTGWKKFSIKNLKKLLLFFWTNNFFKWTINWRNNYTEQTILPNYHSARKWME